MRTPLIWIALLLSCAACATAPRPSQASAEQASGRSFAEQACAGCHAVGQSGTSPNMRAPTFRSLAQRASDAELATALAAISRQGHVEMPPIYTTPEEQRRLIAYIRSLAGAST